MIQNKIIAEDLSNIYPKLAEKLKPLSGKTVLITGASGFVGSWVSELIYFLNTQHQANIRLIMVDKNRELFERNLPHLVNDKQTEFIRCDVRGLNEIPKEVNYIIHGADSPDSRQHVSNPLETMTTIAEGTACVLRAANRVNNLIKFINLSSSAIYATPQNSENITEKSAGRELGISAISAFSEAKRYSEVLCSAARSAARIPVMNLRLFTFCGAYQDLTSPWALNNFLNDALHNRPIKILGEGKTIRSLMYGADLAYWIIIIMLYGQSGDIFNVGNPEGESLSTIAEKVAKCFSPQPSIMTNTALTPITESFPRLVPDVNSARSKFGLEIYTPTEIATQRSVAWYKDYLLNNAT